MKKRPKNNRTSTNDENSETLLQHLYYSLDSPVSYSSLDKLYKAAKQENPPITRSQVREWLNSQLTYTLHKPARVRFKTRRVMVYDIDYQHQMDLVDLSKLSRFNDGYKYILVCIDVLSKYVWLEPLKTKTASEVRDAIKRIYERDNRPPSICQFDAGKEFTANLVADMLKKRGIRFFFTHSEKKASIVERVNRTLKGIMFKYLTRHNTNRYIDILQQLASKYNRSYHRSIKMSPSEVNKENAIQVWMNLYGKNKFWNVKNKGRKLSVGDKVRISVERKTFQKRYEELWTEEIFIISHVILGSPIVYKLKDQNGESIKGTFYVEEISKVNEPSFYRVQKVLGKKKGPDGNFLYLVRWRGYSSAFDSYVTEKDLQKL